MICRLIIFLLLVNEIKYEQIPALLDGDDFNTSNEFRFVVPARSDYFTR